MLFKELIQYLRKSCFKIQYNGSVLWALLMLGLLYKENDQQYLDNMMVGPHLLFNIITTVLDMFEN